MANEYKIKLEVRGRTSEFGADTVTELFYLFATEFFRLDQVTSQANEQAKKTGLTMAARELLKQYHQAHTK